MNSPELTTLSKVVEFLSNVPNLQNELMKIPVDTKLDALSNIGKLWSNPLYERKQKLRKTMIALGFDEILAKEELDFYPTLFDPDYYKKHLDSSGSIGGRHLLDEPNGSSQAEKIRRIPYDKGTLIIGAGNSGLPVVVDLVLALLSNVAPLVKPDQANFDAVKEVVESLKDASEQAVEMKDVLSAFYKSVMIIYFHRDDSEYQYLLTQGNISRIKFTGGEDAYRSISHLASQNPNHVSILAGGPLTGAVILSEEYVRANTDHVVENLAEEILMAGQKLCSSPTHGVWIGSNDGANNFANKLIEKLDSKARKLRNSESNNVVIQRLRLALRSQGAKVVTPEDGSTTATLIISDRNSVVDEVYQANTQLPLNLSRRPIMLELVSLPDLESAVKEIRELSNRATCKGVWKVGTIGYALENDKKTQLRKLLRTYRIKPIGRMFYREPTEPLGGDGESLVQFLTYISYFS